MTSTLATAAPVRHGDGRGSWVPTPALIGAKVLELRRRRGLMISLVVVLIGIPTIYFAVRLIEHAVSPTKFGPAGGYEQFTGAVVAVLYVFGFIMSAMVGATAGTSDLTDGMFRHLVVTGRSRLALYFARIPAALIIVVPLVTAGFIVISAVSSLAAPTTIQLNGASVPYGLSSSQLQDWAGQHVDSVLCNFPQSSSQQILVPCGPRGHFATSKAVIIRNGQPATPTKLSPAQLRTAARAVAAADYPLYQALFRGVPGTLMLDTWGWVLLEALIGVVVGLGLSSLLGQRTLAVVLMLILEIVLTPIASHHVIPYMINVQRGVVGVAMDHIAPSALTSPLSGGNGIASAVTESRGLAWAVVGAWLVAWTALGAWRMSRRDA